MDKTKLQAAIHALVKLKIIAKEFGKYAEIKANIDKREARKK